MPWKNKFVALGLALSAGIFVADIYSPPMFALTAVPHVVSVMLAALGAARSGPWIVAVPAALFTMAGYLIKAPLAADPSGFLINRLTIAAILLLLAWFSTHFTGYRREIELRNESAEARVRIEEGEVLLREIIENVPVGLLIKDADHVVEMANSTYMHWYGHEPDTMVGRRSHELEGFQPEQDAEAMYAQEREVLSKGITVAREVERPFADGTDHYLRITKFPIRNRDGDIVRVGSVTVDMTEQVEARRALEAHEQLLACIVDELPVGVVVKDRENRRILVNSTNCRWYGRKEEDILGKTITDIFSNPGEETLAGELEQEVIRTGKPVSRETTRVFADGTEHNLFISKYPVRDGTGEITGTVSVSVDLTEQVQTQMALKAQEQLLAAIINELPVGLVVKDLENRRTLVNKTNVRWYGHDPKEVLGKTFPETFGHIYEEAPTVDAQENHVIKTGETVHRDTVRRLADGEEHHLHIIKYPVRDEDGNITGTISVSMDLTEQVKSQLALKAQELLLRSIIDNLPAALVVKDLEGRRKMVNETYLRWYDPEPEEVIGGTHQDFRGHDPESELVSDQEKLVVQSRKTMSRETIRSFADGSVHNLRISKYPIYDQEGTVIGVGSVSVDQTEEVQARQAQAESEERFRDFAEVSADWFWEMDADLRFSYFSERTQQITGFDPAAYLGKTRAEISAGYSDERKWARHQEDLENRRPFRDFEYSFEIDGGRLLYARISGKPVFDEQGEFLGYRGTGTDVTGHREIQAARDRALEQAENASRAKSEFLATMSHEFRTPLNAILGFSDILVSRALGPSENEKYQEYAQDINDSAKHLLALVNDLLDISAIEAGKTSLAREHLPVAELLNECVHTVQEHAVKKKVEMRVHAADDLPTLYADRRASKQIILNLLSNAVKFTPTGGSVEVEATAVADGHQIRVTDTGPGIAPERMRDLINPFTRGADDPYRSDDGWGLGLAITHSLVELHDGNLKIDSTLGEGTSVTVFLPSVAQ